MAEKKLTGKALVSEALSSYIRFLKNLEKSIEKASVMDDTIKDKLLTIVFGRKVDINAEFSKRIGFAKIALKEVEKV